MFSLFRRKERLAAQIEQQLEGDLDSGVAMLAENRRRLRTEDGVRLNARARHLLDARDANQYLSKALAEETIAPTAAFELLEAYDAAGYIHPDQFEMHRRHIFDAHRREFVQVLGSSSTDRFDYFRLLDSYRAAGFLTETELQDLEHLLEAKLNPAMAARRLFARAQTTADDELQELRLRRYLSEFPGFPDYAEAASLYLSLKIDSLWKSLPQVRSARKATMAMHGLNNLLEAYLPHTSDLGLAVPINQIVADFRGLVRSFKPEADPDKPITPEHINRIVVVVKKDPGEPGGYHEERNGLFSVGAKGRVKAVRPEVVLVEHRGDGIPYTRAWELEAFRGTRFARLRPNSPLAAWGQEEVGLRKSSRASPVFVHQFRAAVTRMATLLEKHRTDNTKRLPTDPARLHDPDGDADLA